MNKTVLCNAIVISLSASSIQAADFSTTGNNFTMLDSSGNPVGGTNDVAMTWDGTFNTAVTDTNVNMTLASTSTFFGYNWAAHDIRVFGPGTYTFEACTPTSSGCTVPTPMTMTVDTGQIGAHMLFDWNSNLDIDVVNVWDADTMFGGTMIISEINLKGNEVCVPSLGASDCGHATTDPWSNDPNNVWNLSSTDDDSDGVMSVPMVDGPFGGFNGSFNLMLGAPSNVPPVAQDGSLTMDQDTVGNGTVTATDSVDGDPILSYALVDDGGNGTVALNTTDGSYTYTPVAGFNGDDSFTFTATDKDGVSNTATVSITINDTTPPAPPPSSNTAPTAPILSSPADGATGVDTSSVTYTWIKSIDADGDAISYTLTVCDNATFTGCTPETVAFLATPLMVAGLGGAGFVFFGLTGVSPRRRLQVGTLLLALSLIQACAQNSDDDPIPLESYTSTQTLTAGTTYYWRVTASDGTDSTDSAVRSFTTK